MSRRFGSGHHDGPEVAHHGVARGRSSTSSIGGRRDPPWSMPGRAQHRFQIGLERSCKKPGFLNVVRPHVLRLRPQLETFAPGAREAAPFGLDSNPNVYATNRIVLGVTVRIQTTVPTAVAHRVRKDRFMLEPSRRLFTTRARRLDEAVLHVDYDERLFLVGPVYRTRARGRCNSTIDGWIAGSSAWQPPAVRRTSPVRARTSVRTANAGSWGCSHDQAVEVGVTLDAGEPAVGNFELDGEVEHLLLTSCRLLLASHWIHIDVAGGATRRRRCIGIDAWHPVICALHPTGSS